MGSLSTPPTRLDTSSARCWGRHSSCTCSDGHTYTGASIHLQDKVKQLQVHVQVMLIQLQVQVMYIKLRLQNMGSLSTPPTRLTTSAARCLGRHSSCTCRWWSYMYRCRYGHETTSAGNILPTTGEGNGWVFFACLSWWQVTIVLI